MSRQWRHAMSLFEFPGQFVCQLLPHVNHNNNKNKKEEENISEKVTFSDKIRIKWDVKKAKEQKAIQR